jgi:hypothetical protein
LSNWRQYQFWKMVGNLFLFWEMEEDLNNWYMEDDTNVLKLVAQLNFLLGRDGLARPSLSWAWHNSVPATSQPSQDQTSVKGVAPCPAYSAWRVCSPAPPTQCPGHFIRQLQVLIKIAYSLKYILLFPFHNSLILIDNYNYIFMYSTLLYTALSWLLGTPSSPSSCHCTPCWSCLCVRWPACSCCHVPPVQPSQYPGVSDTLLQSQHMVVRKRSGWVEVEAKDKTSSLKDDNLW